MSPQSIKLTEEVKKKYINELENSVHLKKQKLFEYEQKINSGNSLLFSQEEILKVSIDSMRKKISKEAEMLIRFKNGVFSLSDIKSISAIIGSAGLKSDSDYKQIIQGASNLQDKCIQDTANVQQPLLKLLLLQPLKRIQDTVNVQQPLSNQLESSGEAAYHQIDPNSDETINLSSNFETVILSQNQITQLTRESLLSPSNLDDITLTATPQPGTSRSDTFQELHEKEACLMTGLEAERPLQFCDQTSSQNLEAYSLFETELNDLSQDLNCTTSTYEPQTPQTIDMCDDSEYFDTLQLQDVTLQMQQQDIWEQSLSNGKPTYQEIEQDNIETINLSSGFDTIFLSEEQIAQLTRDSLLTTSNFHDIDLVPSIQAVPSGKLPQQQSQGIENLPQRILPNWVNEQNQELEFSQQQPKEPMQMDTVHSHQLQSATSTLDEYLKLQLQKKDIVKNEQVQRLQTPQLNISNPSLLSHPQKMRIVKLVDSANNHILERFYDRQNEVDNEIGSEWRKILNRRARVFKLCLKNRMDMLTRFKEQKTTLEEFNKLVKIARKEQRRLQDFANVQQSQPNHPGSSRLDTSQPVSQLEQLKASIQQLYREEEIDWE